MRKYKVYLVGGYAYSDYLNWVLPLGFEITQDLKQSDLVFFCGGHDINPTIYGHEIHPTTNYSAERDLEEKSIFNKAVSLKKKLWGCCRGAQAICAYQKGGYLIQHSNHPSFHEGITENGEKLMLTSSHHQMAAPFNLNHKILVYTEKLSDFHYLGNGTDINIEKEPEIVFYGDVFGVGSQSHVEWQFGLEDSESKKTVKYHQETLSKLMSNSL